MEAYLTQQGLGLVEELYRDYGRRARELSAAGRGVIGYLCALVPVEIIRAAGLLPLRIKGVSEEAISDADANMETLVCSVVRAWYDVMLKGRYDYIGGLVIPHSCDSMMRTYDIWVNTLGLPYNYLVDLPHSSGGEALTFYRAVLQSFRESLARLVGHDIPDAEISRAVRAYNDYRRRVHELYEMCKCQPPRISGTEVTKTLVAGLGLPVDEATELIEGVIREVRDRPVGSGGRPRLMLFGAEQDSVDFIRIVEDAGADVVLGYFCPGAREYGTLVPETEDPLTGIAERYLNLNCARTYRDTEGCDDPLEVRFGEIGRLAREFDAEGIILMIRRCCDPFGFEVPALKRYFESRGLKTLYLEDEYTPASGRLATRIQAFLEMLPRGVGR